MSCRKASAGRAVSLARKDFPNYTFDRTEKRVFRGYDRGVEVFPKNGFFHLKKSGDTVKVSTFDLMRWTDVFKFRKESQSRKGQNRQFDQEAIKSDYRAGLTFKEIQKKHNVSESTVRRYTK